MSLPLKLYIVKTLRWYRKGWVPLYVCSEYIVKHEHSLSDNDRYWTNSATAGRKGCRMVTMTSDILFALSQRHLTGSVYEVGGNFSVMICLPFTTSVWKMFDHVWRGRNHMSCTVTYGIKSVQYNYRWQMIKHSSYIHSYQAVSVTCPFYLTVNEGSLSFGLLVGSNE